MCVQALAAAEGEGALDEGERTRGAGSCAGQGNATPLPSSLTGGTLQVKPCN